MTSTFEIYDNYDQPGTVRMYQRTSSGTGIDYLLRNVYGPLLLDVAMTQAQRSDGAGLRLLEFGCGAGMVLHHLTETLGERGVDVDSAIGTDFSEPMVRAARSDIERHGSEWAQQRLRFGVARNEELLHGVAAVIGESPEETAGSLHLVVGVNTFRYALRFGTAAVVVAQINALLAPGGAVVIIDMNDRFPYGLKPTRAPGRRPIPVRFGSAALPTLDRYAQPWLDGGFDVHEQRHFCWIPHSANGLRFRAARMCSPLLDRAVGDRAMRSLVIAQKR